MRLGNMYGPDATFAGVPAADLDDPASFADAAAVIVGAPFDGGTSHRSGCRFGPQAIRFTDYLPHDGMRPSLALGLDPLVELGVVDVGDVEMPSGETGLSCARLEEAVGTVVRSGAVPVVLGGDHTIAWPDATACARHIGWGRVSMIHFDAHADTGNDQFGLLVGHGTPMRRLIESGAVRGDRFLQVGLRGYWPEPETLDWMAAQGMRSFEMTEVVTRGLDAVPDRGVRHRPRRLRRRLPLGRRGRRRPGVGAGHGHARAGRPDRPRAARRRAPHRHGAAALRGGRGRAVAALRPRRGHGLPEQPHRARGALGHRLAAGPSGRTAGTGSGVATARPLGRGCDALPRGDGIP